MSHYWPWIVLALLGAYHGLNPAMGWLFALALGLQQESRSAVLTALIPIAAGHAAAIAIAVLLLQLAAHFFPIHSFKWPVAIILAVVGVYRLFRASHPQGSGMRVNRVELAVWSFLMASGHGAGLMLAPLLLAHPAMGNGLAMHHAMTMSMALPALGPNAVWLVTLVHTGAMLITAGILAISFFEVYEKRGLTLLRQTWFNFDLLWAGALLVAAVALLL